ncbi:MAG: hypothetical protein ACI4LH_09360, partial [Candidatus Heritagella sp.]
PHVADFQDPVLIKTVDIDRISRQQQVNAGNFPNIEAVPPLAYTLTVPALMAAKRIICVAPTAYKAGAVQRMLTGPVEEQCPASVLRTHPNAVLYLDSDSGAPFLRDSGNDLSQK